MVYQGNLIQFESSRTMFSSIVKTFGVWWINDWDPMEEDTINPVCKLYGTSLSGFVLFPKILTGRVDGPCAYRYTKRVEDHGSVREFSMGPPPKRRAKRNISVAGMKTDVGENAAYRPSYKCHAKNSPVPEIKHQHIPDKGHCYCDQQEHPFWICLHGCVAQDGEQHSVIFAENNWIPSSSLRYYGAMAEAISDPYWPGFHKIVAERKSVGSGYRWL